MKLARLCRAITNRRSGPFIVVGFLTLRSRVVPSSKTNDELQEALRRAHLASLAANLDMSIAASGMNVSHGQRQLLGLARAMLAHCSMLIPDDATSAMDDKTDEAIQRVLRDEFAESMIMVIGQRLASVAGLSRILVQSNGGVAQFSALIELLAGKGMLQTWLARTLDREKIEAAHIY